LLPQDLTELRRDVTRFGLAALEQKAESHAAMLLRLHLVEDGDRQAVKLAVGALGHDFVEDSSAWIVTDPPCQNLTQLLAIFGLRGGEDLGPHNHLQTPFCATTAEISASGIFFSIFTYPDPKASVKEARTISALIIPKLSEGFLSGDVQGGVGNSHRPLLTMHAGRC
jgi:hypothetical protein